MSIYKTSYTALNRIELCLVSGTKTYAKVGRTHQWWCLSQSAIYLYRKHYNLYVNTLRLSVFICDSFSRAETLSIPLILWRVIAFLLETFFVFWVICVDLWMKRRTGNRWTVTLDERMQESEAMLVCGSFHCDIFF